MDLNEVHGQAITASDFHTGGPGSNPGQAVAPLGKTLNILIA